MGRSSSNLAASGAAARFVVLRIGIVAERTAALRLMSAPQGATGRADAAQSVFSTALPTHGALAVLAMASAELIRRERHPPGPRLAPGLPPAKYRGPM